jgi:hypothetical protein
MVNTITNGEYAQSASDDKAGIGAILNGYDAVLKIGFDKQQYKILLKEKKGIH